MYMHKVYKHTIRGHRDTVQLEVFIKLANFMIILITITRSMLYTAITINQEKILAIYFSVLKIFCSRGQTTKFLLTLNYLTLV